MQEGVLVQQGEADGLTVCDWWVCVCGHVNISAVWL